MPKVFIRRGILQNMSYNVKKGDKKFDFNDKRGKECGKIVEIYRNNKENRSVDNIGEEQKLLEEYKERKFS